MTVMPDSGYAFDVFRDRTAAFFRDFLFSDVFFPVAFPADFDLRAAAMDIPTAFQAGRLPARASTRCAAM